MHHDSCQLEVHYARKPHANPTATSRRARSGICNIIDMGLLTDGGAQEAITGTRRSRRQRRW